VPREQQYFAEHPALYPSYRDAALQLRRLGCRSVGLWVPGDGAEYPLWVLLRGSEIRHVAVDNASAGIPERGGFKPCALVYVQSEGRYQEVPVPAGWKLGWRDPIMRIYLPSPQ
jgi:hypothetical protein